MTKEEKRQQQQKRPGNKRRTGVRQAVAVENKGKHKM